MLHFLRLTPLLAVCLLAACATQPAPETEEAAVATEPEVLELPERQIPADSLLPLLTAEFALRRREYDVALREYMGLAPRLRDPAVSRHTTQLAQYMQREPEALQAVTLWAELEPDNPEPNNTLAVLLTRQGRTPEALAHLAVVARSGNKANFPMLLTGFPRLSLAQQTELTQGLAELAQEFPDNSSLRLAIALAYQQADKDDAALEEVQGLLALDPDHEQAIMLEAALLLELERPRPLARLEQAVAASPDNKVLRLQYARMLTRLDVPAAQQQFEILLDNSPRDGDLLLSLALINRELGDEEAARENLGQLLALGQRTDEAHYYLGRSFQDSGIDDRAIASYRQVGPGREFGNANRRMGDMLAASGDWAQVQQLYQSQRQRHPELLEQLFAIEVGLLTDNDRQLQALDLLNDALQRLPGSSGMQYARAMVWESQGDLTQMEADLRAIIDREPDNATALNALGYTLADRTDRYEEARQLISRALALQPNEPAILDSMGWVNYRLGDFEQASRYLRLAYAAFPDPEVAAHLGEVLWVAGERDEALRVWAEAWEQDSEHTVLTQTLKRLGAPVPPVAP